MRPPRLRGDLWEGMELKLSQMGELELWARHLAFPGDLLKYLKDEREQK